MSGDRPRPRRAGKAPSADELAAAVLDGSAEPGLEHYVRAMGEAARSSATRSARVVSEVLQKDPAVLQAHVARLVPLLRSEYPRVVQTTAEALPALVGVAPAKVARHIPALKNSFPEASDVAKDGIVRTLTALCQASVAYQKRVIDTLERALGEAEPRVLQRWATEVLPVLKGEPHAQARAVVEGRLPELPRASAQKIAAFLGIKR